MEDQQDPGLTHLLPHSLTHSLPHSHCNDIYTYADQQDPGLRAGPAHHRGAAGAHRGGSAPGGTR